MQYEEELEKLNEYQRAAVLDESNTCLVNANVGSGKTTVLIAKIIYLHEAKQVPYEDMVVLTFTNKAADEIRERLLLLDTTVTEDALAGFGTFHSVCLNLLKSVLPIEQLGFTRDFMVMDPEEELQMAEQLILEHQLKIKYKNRLRKRLEKAMAIKEQEKKISRYQDDIFVLTDLLRGEKRNQNKMSFLDLIEIASLLMKGNFSPRWIIIDEVQDSDGGQLHLLEQMKQEETCLFAVGDPNQVIYSWRGSALNVFYTLKSKYGGRELSLPINYRSSGSILEAARFFLQNGSRLEGVKESGSRIVVKNHYNPFQEADYLADKIRKLHEEGIPYREIAIFYRLQNQSKTFEDVFTREGIPFEVSLKKTVQDIPVLKWLLRVLRFAVNPSDITSGVIALCDKEYGDGMKEKDAIALLRKLEKQKDAAEKADGAEEAKNVEEIERTKEAGNPGNIDLGGHKLLRKMLQFQQSCLHNKIQKLLDLEEYFDLELCLKPTSATFAEDKEAVVKLLELMEEYILEEQLELFVGLQSFLNHASLYGMNILKKEINTKEDSVKLMTLHASKGLEFSQVFIAGVNYGLIPLPSKGFEGDDEERRLFFVGITRAKDYLELSYYTSPDQYRVSPGPSRYLSMIPERLVEDDARPKGPKMDTTERLQEIKRQILAARTEMKYLFPEAEKRPNEENRTKVESNSNVEIQVNGTSQDKVTNQQKRVNHTKYGKGVIIKEDENNIVVDFEDYGEKEFLRMFCDLEYLEEEPSI